jgi:hypothetical protein
VPRGIAGPRRLALATLAAVPILIALVQVGPAASKTPTVEISGRAYAFNHGDTGLAGATIRVRELPALAAVADANGDYILRVPDETTVTPYIDPPPGYHQIDLQTFHTRGKPIENANFQTPGDAEYNGLAALLAVPLGPEGRPEKCVIVTTASARNVRGVDFETFRARTPHGVAGATARTKPAVPRPVYFNDNVIPDRSRTETSGDGGIIWTEVPTGLYRVIAESRTTRFASFLATCEPGRIVNANPPWGAYELVGKENPLGAGIVAGSVVHVGRGQRANRRLVTVHAHTAEPLRAKIALRQNGRAVARPVTTRFGPPNDKLPLEVKRDAAAGQAKLSVELIDRAGDSVTERFMVRLPPA